MQSHLTNPGGSEETRVNMGSLGSSRMLDEISCLRTHAIEGHSDSLDQAERH